MTVHFIVRAEVRDPADRDPFDRWYETEHLPDAHRRFGVRKAWRGWSHDEPLVHFAGYEFDSLEAAEAILRSPVLAGLVAEFDATWGDRVTRSREIVPAAQTIESAETR